MFSAYFVFRCLNMFCIEKQVSEFFAAQLATRQSRNPSREFIQKLLATHSRLARDLLATRENFRDWTSRLAKIFATEPHDLPSRKTPRNSFLKGFLWETCFKPLPSSLKPLLQYFYIKTQPIWMVFHSINVSKVIINSFHYFWSLDYVLESFVLLVGIFIIGVGKTYFLSIFFMGLVSFVDMHWLLAPCGRKNMY